MRAVPRAELPPGRWDAFVEGHRGGWWWQTEDWLDYSLSYRPDAVDHSFAAVNDAEEVHAVVPLLQEGDQFSVGGNPGPEPLFRYGDELADYYILRGEVGIRIADVARDAGVRHGAWRGQPSLSEKDGFKSRHPWEDCSWHTHVVTLAGEPEMWRRVRKSYKSLIHRGEPHVVVSREPWAVEAAHGIHRAAAGRETRPQETWDAMARWADEGHAVVALMEGCHPAAAAGRWVAFALAIRWKLWAYYASGASLAPDAHALQWALVKTLRADGRLHYELGWDARPGASEKDKGIAHFKAGWGGELWLVPAVERSFP